jgi:hypothetical protein
MKHAALHPDQLKSHDRGGEARTTPLVLPSMGTTRHSTWEQQITLEFTKAEHGATEKQALS